MTSSNPRTTGASQRVGTDEVTGNPEISRDRDDADRGRDVVDRDRTATTTHTEHRETPVNVSMPAQRRDQVRWGPVWAGLTVALATFVLLEVIFFALGWLTPGANGEGIGEPIISGILGLFAFFLGGLTAGATAMWRGLNTGLLHGIMVWALGLLAFIVAAILGAGSLLGPVADVVSQTASLGANDVPDVNASEAISSIRDAAGYAALALGLAWAAAALGGLVGSKMWSGHDGEDVDTGSTARRS